MENPEIAKIKHTVKELQELARHSRTMSIGAKLLIEKRTASILTNVEIVELRLMMVERENK